MLRWAKNYFEETGEVPTVRAVIGEFGLTTEKFYDLFPEGISKLCELIGAPLPENRMKHTPPPTPPVDLRGEFGRLVKARDLERDKRAFQTVLELYASDAGEFGEDGGELAAEFELLGRLVEGVQNSPDIAECGAILDELVLKLQLLQGVEKLRGDAESELPNLEKWRGYFESQSGAGGAWHRGLESAEARLTTVVVQSDSCRSAKELSSLREFFDEAVGDARALVEEGRGLVEAEKERRARAKEREIIRRSPELIKNYLVGVVPAEFLGCVVVDNQIDARRVAETMFLYWFDKRDLRGEARQKAIDWFVARARRGGLNFIRLLDGSQKLQQATSLGYGQYAPPTITLGELSPIGPSE